MECARRFLSQEEIAQIKSLKVSCDNFHVTFLVINIFFNFSFKRRNDNRLICFKKGFNPNDDDEDVESDEIQKLANEQEDEDDDTLSIPGIASLLPIFLIADKIFCSE